MSTNKTKLFSDTISVTTVEAIYSLPPLIKFSLQNTGDNDVDINLDNATTDSSRKKITIGSGETLNFGVGHKFLHHKVASATGSLRIIGERVNRE